MLEQRLPQPNVRDDTTDSGLAAIARNKRVVHRLRAYRTHLGWSQSEMAVRLSDKLGVVIGQTSVSKWERGQSAVPAVVLLASEELLEQSLP